MNRRRAHGDDDPYGKYSALCNIPKCVIFGDKT